MTNEATTTIQTLTQRSTTMPGHVMKIRRSTLVVAVMLGILLPRVLFAQTYTASPAPFLLVQDNAGSIINAGCVWTYQAGTTTPATTYSTSTGTPNTNPIIADSAGRFTAFLPTGASFKFTYENIPCSSIAHGSVLRTVDGIAATPASSVGVDVTGTAGEAITAGQAVYLSDGSGAKNAGQWYKADSTNTYSATTNWVGIATATISAAASGSIRIAGTVSGLSSLAVGSKYYIGAAGALTATAPTNKRELGEADTATTLVLTGNPRPPANTAGSTGQILTSTGATTDPTWAVPAASVTTVTTTATGNQSGAWITVPTVDFLLRCNNATLLTILGVPAGFDGQRMRIVSIGAGQVDSAHQSGSEGTAGNRLINLATSANTSAAAGIGTFDYQYDLTTARWRLISHEQGDYITYSGTTIVGWAATPTSAVKYYLRGRQLTATANVSGTSNATTASFTIPYTPTATTFGGMFEFAQDSGAALTASGRISNDSGASTTISAFANAASGAWTNSGTKVIRGTWIGPVQ